LFEAEIYSDRSSPWGKLDRDIYGQFVEHLGRVVYGGIWVGEGSAVPNERGFRKDVLEAVSALHPR